jgi:hypothetical protein
MRGRVDERRIIAGNLRRAVLFEDDGGYHLQRRRHEPSAGYPPHRMLDDLADRIETDGGRV